jgi:ACS family allantoate permease-like MFS transporter
MIFLWGLTATTTAFTKEFATLCVNRVFLGVFESCMSPILTILISQYWSREEQALRTSLWWSSSAVGAFIADAITYGVSGKEHSVSKYAIWQIIYLVFGPLTLFWGVIIFFAVPSSPMSAWFLNKRERTIATAQVRTPRLDGSGSYLSDDRP